MLKLKQLLTTILSIKIRMFLGVKMWNRISISKTNKEKKSKEQIKRRPNKHKNKTKRDKENERNINS